MTPVPFDHDAAMAGLRRDDREFSGPSLAVMEPYVRQLPEVAGAWLDQTVGFDAFVGLSLHVLDHLIATRFDVPDLNTDLYPTHRAALADLAADLADEPSACESLLDDWLFGVDGYAPDEVNDRFRTGQLTFRELLTANPGVLFPRPAVSLF